MIETHEIMFSDINSYKLNILNHEFIVYRNGKIMRKMKSGRWKEIKNSPNHKQGYNVLMINKKQFTRSQIIAHAYLKYDINNKDNLKNKMIIYKDKNKLNSNASNLLISNKNHYLCA